MIKLKAEQELPCSAFNIRYVGREYGLSLIVHDTLIKEGMPYVYDIEELFSQVRLSDDEYTRKCLKYIEGAKYMSNKSFIDRTGLPLPLDCLSSGCKVGLMLQYGAS